MDAFSFQAPHNNHWRPAGSKRKLLAPLQIKYFDDLEDLEGARAAFESVWRQQQDAVQLFQNSNYNDKNIVANKATVVSRHLERQCLEQELLRSLTESDDALDKLLFLWSQEGNNVDDEAAQSCDFLAAPVHLARSDAFEKKSISTKSASTSSSRRQHDQEQQLRHLVQRHSKWADPCIQLAALFYNDNRMLEAYEMAFRALELKPWHFATHQLFILLSLRQENYGQALHWARLRLPPLFVASTCNNSKSSITRRNQRRRRVWVARALEQANELWDLKNAELELQLSIWQ